MEYHVMATKIKTALKELYPKAKIKLKWDSYWESTGLFIFLDLENGNEDDGWNFVLDVTDTQILMRDWVERGNDYDTRVRKGYGKARVVNFHLNHFKKAVKANAKTLAQRAADKELMEKYRAKKHEMMTR